MSSLTTMFFFTESKSLLMISFSLETFSLGVLFSIVSIQSSEVVFCTIVVLVFSSVLVLVLLTLNLCKFSLDGVSSLSK